MEIGIEVVMTDFIACSFTDLNKVAVLVELEMEVVM